MLVEVIKQCRVTLKERENPKARRQEATKLATLHFSQRKAVASCLLFNHYHKWWRLSCPRINCSVIFLRYTKWYFPLACPPMFHSAETTDKERKKVKQWSLCYHLCTLAAGCGYTTTQHHAAIYNGVGTCHYLVATASGKWRNFKEQLMKHTRTDNDTIIW